MVSFGMRRAPVGRDEEFVSQIVNEHGAALLGYATHLTGDRFAAEDIVQETLVRAWQRPEILRNGRGSVRGWLLTVTRNIVIDRARARSARPPEVPEIPEQPPKAPDHSEDVVNTLLVTALLDTLSEDHRQVILALYFKDQTVTQAAASLGVPPGTVKSRSYYALRALRDQLNAAPSVPSISH